MDNRVSRRDRMVMSVRRSMLMILGLKPRLGGGGDTDRPPGHGTRIAGGSMNHESGHFLTECMT